FTPSVHLFSQSRGKLTWSDALTAFIPGSSAENERSAGACRGVYELAAVLEDGYGAGGSPRQPPPHPARPLRPYPVSALAAGSDGYLGARPRADAAGRDKAFVD